jgi:cell division protein FtsL
MRIVRRSLAVCLSVLFMAPAAGAQDHVISRSALDQAIQQRVSQEQADRVAILSLLQRSDVRDIAAKAGLSLDKAQAAVSTLQGKDLQQAAQQARQVENNLAGGANTIVISTTTIIIVLLIIILIVVIAD